MTLAPDAAVDDAAASLDLTTLRAVAPQVHRALSNAWSSAGTAISPDLFLETRSRVESSLGLDTEGPTVPGTPLLEATAALTDQFLVYAPGVTEALLAPVRTLLGEDGLEAFVQALYVLDQATRLRLVHDQLFGRAATHDVPDRAPMDGSPPLPLALSSLHAEVMLLSGLDKLTSEIIRLRAASYHQCKLCASLRLEHQGVVVVDESLASRVARNDVADLPAAQVLALRYADGHMVNPKALEPDLVRSLVDHFSRAQIVEMTLDVSQWNQQKILVALGTDTAVSEGGLTPLTFDADGHIVHGEQGSLG
jgi:alkylhydroperoxidase family enzyme